MSSQQPQPSPSPARLLLRYGVVWIVMMLLLAATLASAYMDLGGKGIAVQLAIAAVQVALLWVLFMDLRAASSLVWLCAMAGLFWLIFMFVLTVSDYLTRPWNGGGTSLSERNAQLTGGRRFAPERLPLDVRFSLGRETPPE